MNLRWRNQTLVLLMAVVSACGDREKTSNGAPPVVSDHDFRPVKKESFRILLDLDRVPTGAVSPEQIASLREQLAADLAQVTCDSGAPAFWTRDAGQSVTSDVDGDLRKELRAVGYLD